MPAPTPNIPPTSGLYRAGTYPTGIDYITFRRNRKNGSGYFPVGVVTVKRAPGKSGRRFGNGDILRYIGVSAIVVGGGWGCDFR